MLVIRFIITCAIPDIPGWLAAEMAKIEFARREASRTKNATPSPEEITSKLIGRYTQFKRIYWSFILTLLFRFSVSPSHSLAHTTEHIKRSTEKIKESESVKETTPLQTPTTPGTSSSTSSHKTVGGVTIDSIQEIPPFKPRKSKEWTLPPEVE